MMADLKIRSLTFDAGDPLKVANFWAAALNYQLKDHDEEGAIVVDPAGQQPRLLFLKVPEGKAVKNRLHFDLTPGTTREAEVERLQGLGAQIYRVFNDDQNGHFTVMQDPEGNEFCVEG